jgi:hypothetical protein
VQVSEFGPPEVLVPTDVPDPVGATVGKTLLLIDTR